MSPPLFVDRAMSARFELAEAAQLASMVRAAVARAPELDAAVLEVGGGVAAFTGAGVFSSRAAGIGMRGPVSSEEVGALAEFYRSRGAEARVLVSPYADPTLFEHLGAHGFKLVELDTLLVRRTGDREPPLSGDGLVVRRAREDEAVKWVTKSVEGFWPDADLETDAAKVRFATFRAAYEASFAEWAKGKGGVLYYFGIHGDNIVGTAGLHVHEGTGYLFAASTLPRFRGRGIQSAFIRARIDDALDAGCDLVFMRSAAGGASQRNFERAGFKPAYSQANMMREVR